MNDSLYENKNWFKNDVTNEIKIQEIEQELNKKLPTDLKEFYLWSNGGEGKIGENYISIWKIEDISQLNNEYLIQKYLSNDVLAFGTDGGGVVYILDYSKNTNVYKVSMGDLDPNELVFLGDTFTSFIEKSASSII